MNFKKFDVSDNQWHDVPYYQHKTATDTLTLPAVIYPNDTSITVGLKGQSSQSGTPSPSNPVDVNGTGERTGNLLNADAYYSTYKQTDGTYQTARANLYNVQIKPFTSSDIGKTFTFVANISPFTGNARLCANINGTMVSGSNTEKSVVTFTVETTDDVIFFNYGSGSTIVTTLSEIMLVEGSTAPTSYIPYGYKIPISSANTTTPIYLGEVESTRRIKKLVLTGSEESWIGHGSIPSWYQLTIDDVIIDNLELCTHYKPSPFSPSTIQNGEILVVKNSVSNSGRIIIRDTNYTVKADFLAYLAAQYAAGTPVTVWYVLATPETAVVNEPLRKIGTYADEVSNISIPTIAGANTLSIGTALQPSEVSVNYHGWHPVTDVHERESNYTIATMQAFTIAQLQTHTISELQGGEWS